MLRKISPSKFTNGSFESTSELLVRNVLFLWREAELAAKGEDQPHLKNVGMGTMSSSVKELPLHQTDLFTLEFIVNTQLSPIYSVNVSVPRVSAPGHSQSPFAVLPCHLSQKRPRAERDTALAPVANVSAQRTDSRITC